MMIHHCHLQVADSLLKRGIEGLNCVKYSGPRAQQLVCKFDEIRWDPCPASYNSSLESVCPLSQHLDDPLLCKTVLVQFDDATMTKRLHKNAIICMALK